MAEKVTGHAWRFGDNVDTDQIIPSRYCNTFRPEALAQHALEGADPDFARKVAPGDIIVAGHNFGCGSSREAAPLALRAAGVGAVIAHSFARLFFRNAVNIGLLVLVSPAASKMVKTGEHLEIDPATGVIRSRTSGTAFRSEPFPEYIQEVINTGGMINYVKHRLQTE
jgi:3-isopropylmalate/(R)-2-methylmalate dehydratase small subunit